MTTQKCIFDLNTEELIQLKQMRLSEIETAYFKLTTKELDLKNAENHFWLKTDFKEAGCTNDKMRTAYVSDAVQNLRSDIQDLKFELKTQENLLIIINDLIKLRLQEVK